MHDHDLTVRRRTIEYVPASRLARDERARALGRLVPGVLVGVALTAALMCGLAWLMHQPPQSAVSHRRLAE